MDDDVWRRGGGAVAEVWGNRAAILLRWLLEEEEEEDGGLGSLERVWLLLVLLPVEVEEGGVRQADRVDSTADCGKQNAYNTNDGKGKEGSRYLFPPGLLEPPLLKVFLQLYSGSLQEVLDVLNLRLELAKLPIQLLKTERGGGGGGNKKKVNSTVNQRQACIYTDYKLRN